MTLRAHKDFGALPKRGYQPVRLKGARKYVVIAPGYDDDGQVDLPLTPLEARRAHSKTLWKTMVLKETQCKSKRDLLGSKRDLLEGRHAHSKTLLNSMVLKETQSKGKRDLQRSKRDLLEARPAHGQTRFKSLV